MVFVIPLLLLLLFFSHAFFKFKIHLFDGSIIQFFFRKTFAANVPIQHSIIFQIERATEKEDSVYAWKRDGIKLKCTKRFSHQILW